MKPKTAAIYSLPTDCIEEMRGIVKASDDTYPGAVASMYIRLSLRDRALRKLGEWPPGAWSPAEREAEQIRLNLEYLRERGVDCDYATGCSDDERDNGKSPVDIPVRARRHDHR